MYKKGVIIRLFIMNIERNEQQTPSNVNDVIAKKRCLTEKQQINRIFIAFSVKKNTHTHTNV